MPRPSKIDRLPTEVREEIGLLRRQGRTIDEIMAKLHELLPPEQQPSWSGLQRHVQRIEVLGERIRRSREVANALVDRYGTGDEMKVLRINVELLHEVIGDLISGEDGEKVTLDAKQASFLAGALRNLSAASKTDADRELKIRRDAERKAKDEAAKAVEQVGKRAGLSADLLDKLKVGVFGKDAV